MKKYHKIIALLQKYSRICVKDLYYTAIEVVGEKAQRIEPYGF